MFYIFATDNILFFSIQQWKIQTIYYLFLTDMCPTMKIMFQGNWLISLKNLICLAMALGYTAEIKNIFAQPKYSTLEELTQIRKNKSKTKAYKKKAKI